MAAADTNVLVRLLTADDREQTARAEALLQREQIWISTVVLVETIWVLISVYQWQKRQILALLRTLIESRDFLVQEPHAVRSAIEIYSEHKADFAECLALELGRAHDQVPFYTFDRDAAALPGAQEPEETP